MMFSVEGNIGAGKSTLLQKLDEHLKKCAKLEYCVLLEPVDQWITFKPDGCEKSLFELFYQDNKKYGFAFQLYALQSRYEQLINTLDDNKNRIIITERCPLTDNEVFAKIMHQDGCINHYEYAIYCKWHNMINNIMKIHMSGIIYIKTSDDVCATRVIKRQRNGEGGISLDYLKKLNKQHDIWLDSEVTIPKLELDGDKEATSENMTDHLCKIVDFICKNMK